MDLTRPMCAVHVSELRDLLTGQQWQLAGRVPIDHIARSAAAAWNQYQHPDPAVAACAVDAVVEAVWPYALGEGERYAQITAVRVWRQEVEVALDRLDEVDRSGEVGRYLRALDGAAVNVRNMSISPVVYRWPDQPDDLAYRQAQPDVAEVYRPSAAANVARSIRAVWPLGHRAGRVSMAAVINQLVPRHAGDLLEADRDVDLTGSVHGQPMYLWLEQARVRVRAACEPAPAQPPEEGPMWT